MHREISTEADARELELVEVALREIGAKYAHAMAVSAALRRHWLELKTEAGKRRQRFSRLPVMDEPLKIFSFTQSADDEELINAKLVLPAGINLKRPREAVELR